MTTLAFAAELDAALSVSNMHDSIGGIKSVVAREIQATDSSVQIRDTGYFNHSHMPDFVLEWPEDTTADQRFVYLKLGMDTSSFVRDVLLVDSREPIVFSIGRRPDADVAWQRLIAAGGGPNTMLTDAEGLAALIERRRRSPDLGLVTTALAQDGRGVLTAPNAAAVADAFSAGIEAARALSIGETHRALATLSAFLRERQARLLTQLLEAVWVGSGGGADIFPLPATLSSRGRTRRPRAG